MPVTSPEEMPKVFMDAFNSQDLDALMALYEPDAVFVPQPGQPVSGTAAVREAMTGFFAINPRIEGQIKHMFQAGDIALALLSWTISGTGPDGSPMQFSDTSADVFHRQSDGTWLVAVDNPWTRA